MNPTVALLTYRTLLGRRRALLLALLPVVLLAVAGGFRWAQGQDSGSAVAVLGGFGLGTVIPLLGLLAGTGAIGPEIDDGSIVYLLSKPISRWVIVLSKAAVAVATVLLLGAVPVLLAGVVLVGSADRLAVGYAVGAACAGVAYVALFLLLSIITRNAVVIGLVYALVWETTIAGVVPGARTISVRQWALSVTGSVVGEPARRLGVDAAVGPVLGGILLVGFTVAVVLYAGQALRNLRLASPAD